MEHREQLRPKDRKALRAWLRRHHLTSPGAWIAVPRKSSGRTDFTYEDIVEELLCFGWIDGQARRLDAHHSELLCTPRSPRSAWAKTNKARVERLTEAGLMAPRGLEVVAQAKASGAWNKLDAAESLVVPPDLARSLRALPPARRNFDAFPPSIRKLILFWISEAKRPETRRRRIEETATRAQRGLRPKQWQTRR